MEANKTFANLQDELRRQSTWSSRANDDKHLPESKITDLVFREKSRRPLSNGICNTTLRFPCVCEHTSNGFVVNCSNSNLTSVPMNIPKDVTELILSYNKIRIISAGVFQNLARLERLEFSNNYLTALGTDAFEGLHHLKTLILNENPLNLSSKTFADNVFAPLSSLVYLNLKSALISDDPAFQYPDVALSKIPTLQKLAINGLSNRTFGEGVQKMTSLKTLDLSHSPLFNTLFKDTFVNFKNISITTLDLSYCDLTWIHREAFFNLPNIDTIDYSYNERLEISGVGVSTYSLQNSTIRKIVMRRVHERTFTTILTADDLQYLTNTNLEEINMDNNTIGLLYPGLKPVLAFPVSLKVVTLSWNNLATDAPQILLISRLKNLEYVDFSEQEVYGVSTVVPCERSLDKSLYRRQEHITNPISDKNLAFFQPRPIQSSYYLQIYVPPLLRVVNCSRVYKIKGTVPAMEFINSSLEYIDFSVNEMNKWQGPIKGVKSLRYLDLTHNHCRSISETFFAYMTALETLFIGKNNFGRSNLSDNTFYNLTTLRILHMDDIQMETVGLNLFSRLNNLTHLQLAHNYISDWRAGISGLVNLQYLNLTNNKLRELPQSLCQDLDQIQTFTQVQIDIQGNPFQCECDTILFVEWLSQTKVHIRALNNTFCTLTNGSVLSMSNNQLILDHLQRHCRSYSFLIGGLSTFLVLFLLIVSIKIFHRQRWKIRYLCYMASNWRKRTGYQRLDSAEENPFGFDAFISYEDSDRTFVCEQIIPHLETEAGLKLCIDKRDFIPGLYVTDNILHAIQSSRKTVVLLSREFLKSKWCIYELNMARMEGIYNGRVLLVMVLTEEIPVSEMSPEVLDIVHHQTYIEMTNNRYGEALMWERLVTAIKSD